MFKRLVIIFGLLFFLYSPVGILAVNYGEGIYGDDNYQSSGLTPIPTAIPTSTQQNTNSSSPSFNTTAPGCDKSVTPNAPDLFEIRASKDNMVLYFTPPNGEYSSFFIAFSRDGEKWEYGAEYDQNYYPGVLRFTVNLLNPKTTYYVKIRPGNGCATGNWSNVLKATTTSSDEVKVFYEYGGIKSVFQSVKTAVSKINPFKNSDKKEETATPTAVPTITEEKNESNSESNQTTEKKKFCFLWWCW